MKIIFFGTPDFAVSSLRTLVENNMNVAAVVTIPDKEMGRGKKLQESAVKVFAKEMNLPILQPERLKSKKFVQSLQDINADVHIVVAFRMLPEVVWNMPRLGTINVHGSLLPAYRGAAPINWALIHGRNKTGVTTFRLRHEIDTGDILMQTEIDIQPEDDFGSLYEKMKHLGATLLIKTLNRLSKNELEAIPQSENESYHHAPKLTKELQEIDWNNKGKDIHNLIRGLSPIPAARTQLKGKVLKVFKSKYIITPDKNAAIGTYESDHKTYLKYATTDGWLYLEEVQYEGKKRMLIEDFLRGFRP